MIPPSSFTTKSPSIRNGKLICENAHGTYGHLLGRSVGMCYLKHQAGITRKCIEAGTYEIGLNGKRYPITIHLATLHDPKGQRADNNRT
jgi:4-methylaminobutanoate oxidase (formaldehyde-forming)